jgi:LacI family transcriptional regulator
MKRSSQPTLQDVARSAGVSTATISRCISQPQLVAKGTRERIEHAIAELGYTPHFGARVLASNRTNTIGAVIPVLTNAMFAMGVQAFQEALTEQGVTLLIATSGYDPMREYDQIRTLLSHGADGLMLIGVDRPAKTRKLLALRGVPHVITWTHRSNDGALSAGFNNRKAARKMAEKVIKMGHRRLAIISGITAHNDRARDRTKGVLDAVAASGGRAHITAQIEAPYMLDAGGDAFDAVMQYEHPSAVICGNDVLAAGAILRAKQRGLELPRDMSFTGFDDIGLARAVDPALTTMRVPQEAMGRAAAQLLLGMVAGETGLKNVKLKPEMILRDSLIAAA